MNTLSMPARIQLTSGRFMLVDTDDVPKVVKYGWYPVQDGPNCYSATTIGGRRVFAHRLIAGATDTFDPESGKWRAVDVVDHANGDGLDNRRQNLRIASRAENQRNTRGRPRHRRSRFKGVSFCRNKTRRRWRATIEVKGRQLSLGCYETQEAAALAYNAAAALHFGAFAYLNSLELPNA